jgi:hypothetical protein
VSVFWGVTGFCHIWILGYADLARPLYWLLKEAQQNSQSYHAWDLEGKKTFQTLKQVLQSALALSLPTQDHFQLYVYGKGGLALGVLSPESTPHSHWDI